MLKKIIQYSLNSWRYRQLFWSIILLFIFSSFVTSKFNSLVTATLLTLTIFLMLRTLAITSYWRKVLQLLVIVALVCIWLTIVIEQPVITEILGITSSLIYSVYLASAIAILSRQLIDAKKVDADILIGAICVYLLIGIFWSLLYNINFILDPQSFVKLLEDKYDVNFRLLYFSFTTLTTLGYGDITPTLPVAMGLSNLEAIVGQMYPSVFVARLVSLYIISSQTAPKDEVD